MRNNLTTDFIRGNKTSSITIAVTVIISSFLLTLLTTTLYNFWIDAALQAQIQGADWHARITGELAATASIYLGTTLLGCIALVLIIRNAFAASMQTRVHQLGILSTVGATPRQIRGVLIRESLMLSIIPGAAGIVLGIGATAGFIPLVRQYAQSIGIERDMAIAFHFDPLLLLAIVALVFLTVFVSAGLPARKMAKISPLQAVRGLPEDQLDKQVRRGICARLFGIEGELAAGAIRLRRSLLRSTSIALGLSFVIFIVFLSFMTVSKVVNELHFYRDYGDDPTYVAQTLAQNDAIWNGYALVVGAFCAILALIGIAAVVTQALGFVSQRKREFARYRSIGMTPGGIYRMLCVEGLLTVIRPLLIALVPAAVLSIAMVIAGRLDISTYAAAYPYAAVGIYALIIFAIVFGAYLIGAHRVNQCDLVMALRDDTLM